MHHFFILVAVFVSFTTAHIKAEPFVSSSDGAKAETSKKQLSRWGRFKQGAKVGGTNAAKIGALGAVTTGAGAALVVPGVAPALLAAVTAKAIHDDIKQSKEEHEPSAALLSITLGAPIVIPAAVAALAIATIAGPPVGAVVSLAGAAITLASLPKGILDTIKHARKNRDRFVQEASKFVVDLYAVQNNKRLTDEQKEAKQKRIIDAFAYKCKKNPAILDKFKQLFPDLAKRLDIKTENAQKQRGRLASAASKLKERAKSLRGSSRQTSHTASSHSVP